MEMPLHIGLAPMEGVSDLAFRLWISLCSDPEWAATPFLRVTSNYPGKIPSTFAPEINRLKGLVRYQLTSQLMAASPEDFIRVAGPLLSERDFVELNCGCPSPNTVGSGAGSSLLKDAGQFSQFIGSICDQLAHRQIAVKMRLGFERADEFEGLLSGLLALPLRQLTVHARTRKDRYAAYAQWDRIQLAAKLADFPVIGSGDILGLDSLRERAHQLAGLKGIIIGRGALRNPWIFQALRNSLARQELAGSVIMDALVCYVLLVELQRNQFDQLLKLVETECFLKPCLDHVEAWQQMRQRLMMLRFGSDNLERLADLDRSLLGRVKLIWNYLRSSLPPDFFNPQILRCKSLVEFFAVLVKLFDRHESVCVQHRPEYDWVYTSDKKDPGRYPGVGA